MTERGAKSISGAAPGNDPFPTSISLLQLAMQGDFEAWHTVVELYTEWIASCCQKRGFREHDADDIAQNVLMKLFEIRGRFQVLSHKGAFRAWLNTTALNEARDLWKQRQAEYCGGGSSFHAWLDTHPANSSAGVVEDGEEFLNDRHELIRRVKHVMDNHLPVKREHLDIFRRREIDGVDAQDVADEFGTTQNNVRQICWRIKQKIRELLDDQC
jgi:RNA polymerase sigma factor (sigma-70 family)